MNRPDRELAEHQPWLRRVARRLAGSTTRADDLVQDTYATALRNAPPDVQWRPWLLAVIRKLAWGQVRSERRRMAREATFSRTAPQLSLPDALLEGGNGHGGIDRARLSAAVASLPEPYQSTIVQRFIYGRSCADIARRDDVAAGTVRWRQARGIELLRAELDVPRRRFVFWVLPVLGAGEQLVVRAWRVLIPRLSSKLLWLACAGLLYAILTSARPPGGSIAGDTTGDRGGLAFDVPGFGATLVHAGGGAWGPRPVSAAVPAAGGLAPFVGPAAGAPSSERAGLRAASSEAFDADRDDCVWDPVSGRRCTEPPVRRAEDASCASLRRQLLVSGAREATSPVARMVIAATMQAHRALAGQLGCTWPPDLGLGRGNKAGTGSPGAGRTRVEDGKPVESKAPDETPPAEPPPGCTTGPDITGAPCTVCPGQPALCTPAECQTRTVADGVVCTSCLDPGGYFYDWPLHCSETPPASCQSEISPSGLLCSTCDGQAGPECMPAECTVGAGGCLRCVDPKGRVGVDCSVDYSAFPMVSLGGGTGAFFGSCTFTTGVPGMAGLTCHYPGNQSCVAEEAEGVDWHCLSCRYRDGSGTGLCSDASNPLPDPFADRPSGLPAPGTCATARSRDGTMICATCTRADRSATMSCQVPTALRCVDRDDPVDPDCPLECEAADGSSVAVCYRAPGTF